MRKFFIVISIILCINENVEAQEVFNGIFSKINWHGTESELVTSLSDIVVKSPKQSKWDNEHSESNYSFRELGFGKLSIKQSYIRVSQDTKKIFRLNFILLDDATELISYNEAKIELIKEFGAPTFEVFSNNMNCTIFENTTTWMHDDYKIEAIQIDTSNRYTKAMGYIYALSVEPISTFRVNWNEATVEKNVTDCPIPKIEYFRFDNEENVYLKEEDKQESLLRKVKTIVTPKGTMISFEDGIICHRKKENDIVYANRNTIVVYPVKSRYK